MPAYVDATGVTNLTSNIKSLADATYPANEAVAQEYDATSAYVVGDYCIHGGLLYKCNTAIAAGGETWTAAHWTKVSVVDELGSGGTLTGVVRADTSQSFTAIEKQQARENILAEAENLRFFNTVVPTSAFASNDTQALVYEGQGNYTSLVTVDKNTMIAVLEELELSSGTYSVYLPPGGTDSYLTITPGNYTSENYTYDSTTRTYTWADWGVALGGGSYSGGALLLTMTYNANVVVFPNYVNYPYHATIPLSNVTNSMSPDVIFNVDEATSGIYAPIAEAYNGGIYIYSSVIPPSNITIPLIACARNGGPSGGTNASSANTLYLNGTCSVANNAQFCDISDSRITDKHIVVDHVFSDASLIESKVYWSTVNGHCYLSGTCTDASLTVTLTLTKKNN